MSHVAPTTIISHWSYRIDGLQYSSSAFYSDVERILGAAQVDHLKIERVKLAEGGMFSSKREYLQVRRGEHVFLVCAAPFGNGFFISWWLGHVESGFWAWLSGLPLIGFIVQRFLKRLTYYQIDTALMFQSVTHTALTEVLAALTEAKGLKALSDTERTPVMRDFFAQLGGN